MVTYYTFKGSHVPFKIWTQNKPSNTLETIAIFVARHSRNIKTLHLQFLAFYQYKEISKASGTEPTVPEAAQLQDSR